MKNALDQAYVEWNRKVFGVVACGTVGGPDFFAVHPPGGDPKPMAAIEGAIGGSAEAMPGELDWWARPKMSVCA